MQVPIGNSTENQIPDLVNKRMLPERCGLRIEDDNPFDPLMQPKIIKGQPTKPGSYPWQVGLTFAPG